MRSKLTPAALILLGNHSEVNKRRLQWNWKIPRSADSVAWALPYGKRHTLVFSSSGDVTHTATAQGAVPFNHKLRVPNEFLFTSAAQLNSVVFHHAGSHSDVTEHLLQWCCPLCGEFHRGQ